MKSNTRHGRRLQASIFLALFAAAWLVRVMHGLVLHTDHHDRPVCEAAHDGGNTQPHLHDHRYAPDNCPVCALWFSIPELLSVTAILKPRLVCPSQSNPLYAPPILPGIASDSMLSRGPPVL